MRYVSKENLSQFWGGVKSWLNDKFTITKNKITDWPSTFPPSSHTHTISQITDLQNQLNGKLFFNPTVEHHWAYDIVSPDYTISDMAVGEVKSVSIIMNGAEHAGSLYLPRVGSKYYVLLFPDFSDGGSYGPVRYDDSWTNGNILSIGKISICSLILDSGTKLFNGNNTTFGLIIRLS